MDHGPNITIEESDELIAYKSKLGLKLFALYATFYIAFVAINTVSPAIMKMKVFWGLNLAVVYGFSLIFLAIIMGLIYNFFCNKKEEKEQTRDGGDDQ